MKIYKELEQGTKEWLQVRCGKITASNFHTFLGDSKTKEDLILGIAIEKITGIVKDSYKNDAMIRGTELEAEARNCYEFIKECNVEQIGFFELDSNVGFSPDGLINKNKLLEIKCPTEKVYFESLLKLKNGNDTGIKPEYKTQMQFGMYITGFQSCDFVIYNPSFKEYPIFIYEYKRDEEYIEKIKKSIELIIIEVEKYINKYKEII